jgi:hypothetical protein
LYGKGRNGVGETGAIPPGYDETRPVGRPKEKASIVGTQKRAFGKDPLGSIENSTLYTANQPDEGSGTPKAMFEVKRHKELFESIDRNHKKSMFDIEPESGMLDEKNIKDI